VHKSTTNNNSHQLRVFVSNLLNSKHSAQSARFRQISMKQQRAKAPLDRKKTFTRTTGDRYRTGCTYAQCDLSH
jgi:hypothetical protein